MKIAFLTTDNREHLKLYDRSEPLMPPAQEALLQGFQNMPDATVHVISCSQQPMESPEKLAGNIWFHLLHVPKSGWLRTGYQGCIRAVRRKLRELGPDIIHGQGTERDCAMSAAFSGLPAVITIHGNMAELARMFGASVGSYKWLAARLENLVLPRVAGVFCNSFYTQSLVRDRAIKTWLVPNPLRLPFFDIPLTNRAQPSTPILLNIGVISERKRQLDVIDMAEHLRSSGHEVELLFVGAADPHDKYATALVARMEKVQSFAHHCHVDSVLELIGLIDSSAGLIHIPSEEAFGLVVAEALSRNLKFFGTRVGGIPDIADGIEGAELFELNDPASLRLRLAEWLDLECPRPKSAAVEMRRRYEPRIIAKRHLEIYNEVIDK